MRILNGKDTLGLSVDFAVKTIDIDFYNTINRTLFLGHKNDSYLTQLHLIVPTLDESSGIYVSFYNNDKQESIGTFIVTSVEIGEKTEYYFPITNGEITSEPHKGYLQFFIVKNFEDNNEEEQIIASSERIKYIIEDSLTIESDQEYVTSIITYLNNNVVNWGNRLTEAEEDIQQLTNNLTNKINKNTNLSDSNDNEVLLYDKNNVYKASGKVIGGNTFSNQKTKTLATERGVERYVENELKKVATSDNSMMFEDTNNSIPTTLIKSNLIRTGFLGGEKGLIFSATAQDVEKSAELFLGILGSLKTRNFNSTIPNAWSDWKNVEREGNVPELTQEMYDKINAALTDATEWVENNENKKRNEIPDNYENDIVSYPSMATLGAFYNNFVAPLLSDVDDIKTTINGINNNITNINTNLSNKMSKMSAGSADKLLISNILGEATISEKSIDDSGTFYSNENSRNQRIPTEQVIVNYINSLDFATQEEIEAIEIEDVSHNNLFSLDTTKSESGVITINEKYVTLKNGVTSGSSFTNISNGMELINNKDYYIRMESNINCSLSFYKGTQPNPITINSNNFEDNFFVKISKNGRTDTTIPINQMSLVISENITEDTNVKFYLFQSNELLEQIIDKLQLNKNDIEFLKEKTNVVIDWEQLITAQDLDFFSDSIIEENNNYPIVLKNTKFQDENFSINILNNQILVNGTLEEDTTFEIPLKYRPMFSNGENNINYHLIFSNLEDLDDKEINGELSVDLGGITNTYNINTINDYIDENYSGKTIIIPSSTNFRVLSNNITLTLSAGTYLNNSFYFIGELSSNSLLSFIYNIEQNGYSAFQLKSNIIPQSILQLPNQVNDLSNEVNILEEEIQNFKVGDTLEDYGIEDAYTKNEIEERDTNIIDLNNGSSIAFKNKIYEQNNITVEITNWNTIRVQGYGTAAIQLEPLFNTSHYLKYLHISDLSEIEEDVISLQFVYNQNGGNPPVIYSYNLPNTENPSTGDLLYPMRMSGTSGLENSSITLMIGENDGIDYSFKIGILDSVEEKNPVVISSPLLENISNNIGSVYNTLNNNKISKYDLFTSYEDTQLLNLTTASYALLPSSATLTTQENEIEVSRTGGSAGNTPLVTLSLVSDIILEVGKTYGFSFSCDNGSSEIIINLIDDEENIYKTYTLNSSTTYIYDSIYIRNSNITIQKITCKVADGFPAGKYYLNINPVLGIIKEDALGLDRFIENGEVNTPLKYSSSTAYRLTGTYRLKDGFCYLTAQADCYPGWAVMYYDLPVAPIKDATVLGCNATRLYEVGARALHPDSQEASSLAIIPLERKFSPNPSTDVYASGDPINITICYKYR